MFRSKEVQDTKAVENDGVGYIRVVRAIYALLTLNTA